MDNNTFGRIASNIIEEAMPYFFMHLNQIIHRYQDEEYNLFSNQIKVIKAVSLFENLTPATLSRIFHIQKGSLTTIIQSLVEMGLLVKNHSKSDPRRYTMTITPKCSRLIKKKLSLNIKQYDNLFADMPQKDFTKVAEGITILVDYLKTKKEEA